MGDGAGMTLPKRAKRNCHGFSQGVCVWFDPLTVAAIDRMAASHGLSRSEWMRRTLVKAVAGTVEEPPPEQPATAPRGRQLPLALPKRAR